MWEGRMLVQGAMPGISLYPASKLLRQDQEAHTLRRLNICRLARTVCMYTVNDRIFGDFPANNTVYTPCVCIYIFLSWRSKANSTHAFTCFAPSLLYVYHKIRFGCFDLFFFSLYCFSRGHWVIYLQVTIRQKYS